MSMLPYEPSPFTSEGKAYIELQQWCRELQAEIDGLRAAHEPAVDGFSDALAQELYGKDPAAVGCAMMHADGIDGESEDAIALRRLAEEVRRLRSTPPPGVQPADLLDVIARTLGGDTNLAERVVEAISSAGLDLQDAARYRWLRCHIVEVTDLDTSKLVMSGDGDGLDELIDSALTKEVRHD